jgi:hypothetical protein
MSSQGKPIVLPQTPSRTPVTRTRSQRSRLKLHSPLKHNRPVLQPSNINSTPSNVPTSSFTFAVDLKAHTLMPPRAASTASQGIAKKKTAKNTRLNASKGKGLAPNIKPAAVSLAQSTSKRALSPVSIFDSENLPSKRFKSDVSFRFTRILRVLLTTSLLSRQELSHR